MNFLDLVDTAFFSQDNSRRALAERDILAMKDANIDQFFVLCAQGLGNPDIMIPLRQACGTLVKRCVPFRTAQGVESWLLCQPQTKQIVKDNCLKNLVFQDPLIKRAAANAISEICAVELPRNEWPDIVNTLSVNCENPNIEVKTSAMMTLGFICESLKNAKHGISEEDSAKMLYGICVGLKEDQNSLEIQKISLKALQDSLFFLRDMFINRADGRNYVSGLLLNAAQSNDISVRILALQCLIDFVKQLHDVVNTYLEAIFKVSLPSIEHKAVEVATPAMEIWTVFCQEVKDRITQERTHIGHQQVNAGSPQLMFIQANYEALISPLLRNLFTNETIDDDDIGGLSIQESAYKCLAAIVDITPQSYQWLTQFISVNLMSEDWVHRNAAVLSFGALAETEDNMEIQGLIFNALSPLVKTLEDSHIKVRITGARVLSKVAEHYPDIFFNHQDSQGHLNVFFQTLSNCQLSVAKNVVWVLTFITEQLVRPEVTGIYVAQKLAILSYLASIAIREEIDSHHYAIIDTCFMGILNVVYSITTPENCRQYLMQFHQKLIETNTGDPARARHLQSGLLSAMHGSMIRLNYTDLTEAETDLLFTTYEQLIQHPDLNSDALYAVSSMASCLKKKFERYAQRVFPVLNSYLQNTESIEAFKTSLLCLADISRALEERFSPYTAVVDYLIGLIHNTAFDRDLKIQVYIALADISLGIKIHIKPFAPKMIDLIKIGFQGCVSLTKQGSQDSLDYADRFKEHLMQYYTCIMHALCDQNLQCREMFDTLPWLFEFAETTCDRALRPTVEYVRLTLNAILDAGNFFHSYTPGKDLVKKYLTSKFVVDLIQTIGKFTQQSQNVECYNYAVQLLKSYYQFTVPATSNLN